MSTDAVLDWLLEPETPGARYLVRLDEGESELPRPRADSLQARLSGALVVGI